jgi:hypothetical protein
MPYEVDQSGKMESKGDTVLGLANATTYAVRVPALEKTIAAEAMKRRFTWLKRNAIYMRLFTAALYYLLRDIRVGETVTIDREYTGHEASIKSMLLNWLRQDKPDISSDDIRIRAVGKISRSHKLALAVYQGKTKANRIVKADDLLSRIIGQ